MISELPRYSVVVGVRRRQIGRDAHLLLLCVMVASDGAGCSCAERANALECTALSITWVNPGVAGSLAPV